MDPNANLRRQRELVKALLYQAQKDDNEKDENFFDNACELAELVEALDEWIKTGNFLPDRWQLKWKWQA